MRKLQIALVALTFGATQLMAQKLTANQVIDLVKAGKTPTEIEALNAVFGEAATPAVTAPAVVTTAKLTVPRKVAVDIRIADELSSKKTGVGPFKCSVDKDVKIDGHTVISEGTPATCRVVAVEEGGVNHKGWLEISADSVKATDGTEVLLSYKEKHGGGVAGPKNLFSKGVIKIASGTILPTVVDEKTEVAIPSAQVVAAR